MDNTGFAKARILMKIKQSQEDNGSSQPVRLYLSKHITLYYTRPTSAGATIITIDSQPNGVSHTGNRGQTCNWVIPSEPRVGLAENSFKP